MLLYQFFHIFRSIFDFLTSIKLNRATNLCVNVAIIAGNLLIFYLSSDLR